MFDNLRKDLKKKTFDETRSPLTNDIVYENAQRTKKLNAKLSKERVYDKTSELKEFLKNIL
jgi:hypothetical protein